MSRARVVERGRGALEGAGIGFLAGAVAGGLVGLASGDDTCQSGSCIVHLSAPEKAAILGVLLGSVGLVSGAIIGALVGHHDELEFTSSR